MIVPDLPPGFSLVVNEAAAWTSYGWIKADGRGAVVAFRNGLGSPEAAARSAWDYHAAPDTIDPEDTTPIDLNSKRKANE